MDNKYIIHKEIINKLNYYKTNGKIPNLIFHGPSGSGKKTIVNDFIKSIYNNNKELIKSFVMSINCAHGKGIKFVREELKFFAKTHIYSEGGLMFKSIILINADKLTMDAQSALRRCIELFSHNTRFFMVVENKYKLLKPILSRFCQIYVHYPIINNKVVNLYEYTTNNKCQLSQSKKARETWLKKQLLSLNKEILNVSKLKDFSNMLYEKGYSGLDLIAWINTSSQCKNLLTVHQKYELLVFIDKIKQEFRNEQLFMLLILNFTFLNKDYLLETRIYI